MTTNRDYNSRRDTARGIVIKDGRLLLIERFRPGMHYFSTPGGGIEQRETPEQAVERELMEETSIKVSVEREIYTWQEGPHTHHFFLCTYISGEPSLHHDAEEASNGPNNVHLPRWVDLEEAASLSFGYWEPLKDRLLKDIKEGLPKEVVHLTA